MARGGSDCARSVARGRFCSSSVLTISQAPRAPPKSIHQLAALRSSRTAWAAAEHYAHLLEPIELEGEVEFALGSLQLRRGAFVEAERHLARAHLWHPCTRTCAIHANALWHLPGRELQAFALASRYGQFGMMGAILADPRMADFEANRPKKGRRWVTFSAPSSEKEVAAAERNLGRSFDPRYRAFALTVGAGTISAQSSTTVSFLAFESVETLVLARNAFRAWFDGKQISAANKRFKKWNVLLSELLPIAAPSETAGYLLMDWESTACFAWDHDALFELLPLAPSVDVLISALHAGKRWPFS